MPASSKRHNRETDSREHARLVEAVFGNGQALLQQPQQLGVAQSLGIFSAAGAVRDSDEGSAVLLFDSIFFYRCGGHAEGLTAPQTSPKQLEFRVFADQLHREAHSSATRR